MADYIAGPFQVKLAGTTIGDTDGVWVSWSPSMELINSTDSMARTPVDGIFRGGQCFISFNVITANPLLTKAYTWPFDATFGTVGTVGQLASSVDFALTLTGIAGTNSAGAIMTASSVVPAPDFPMRLNLAPSLMRTMLRFQCLPYTNSGSYVWFVPSTGTPATVAASPPYIAGACTVTWDDDDIGDTDLNSIQLEYMHHYEPIQGDAYGDTVVDMIYQGSEAYINLVMLQVNADGVAVLWPYGTQGAIAGTLGSAIGRLHRPATSITKALVITPVANTPSATYIGNITAGYATLAPGHVVEGRMGPTLRKIPLRSILFPDPSTNALFSVTAPG